MLRYRIEVLFMAEDGTEQGMMGSSVVSDNLPRVAELIGPIQDIKGAEEVVPGGLFKPAPTILQMGGYATVKRVSHGFVHESYPSDMDAWSTMTTVTVEMPY